MKKHDAERRRAWRKLHLAVDPNNHAIAVHSLTKNDIHDGDQVESLLEQVESCINPFYGDGAYNQWKVHDSLQAREINAIIPPRKNAKIKQYGNFPKAPLPRDEAVRQIRREAAKTGKNRLATTAEV